MSFSVSTQATRQKKEQWNHFHRASLITSQISRLGLFVLGTGNDWVQGETARQRAHDSISSNPTQLLQRVWEVICLYHCCQPKGGSLPMACDKPNIFTAVPTSLSPKNAPHNFREKEILTTAVKKKYFLM